MSMASSPAPTSSAAGSSASCGPAASVGRRGTSVWSRRSGPRPPRQTSSWPISGHALGALGRRGYRAAQLEAGIVAGRIYLCAYADHFGATGLTFYDDEVTRFFSPDAEGKNCMLVVAVGDSPRLSRRR
jgi:hypothetical protein